MSHPRDMSDEDFMALPVGPDMIVPLSDEDIAAGMGGKAKLVRRRTLVRAYAPDDIIFRIVGRDAWSAGQWEDGTWFRQPFCPL
jgi:hypothetical protein